MKFFKKKNFFPILAGIFLIYLLCNLTYNGGNQEGFIEGFLEGARTIESLDPAKEVPPAGTAKKAIETGKISEEKKSPETTSETACADAGKAAYDGWVKCYKTYKKACEGENFHKMKFCKTKYPCASDRQRFLVYKSQCETEGKEFDRLIKEFKDAANNVAK